MNALKSMADEELAMAYINGNNGAFDELLSRSQDKIFNYIFYVVKDDDLSKPLRKTNKHPFCTIDEDNLRMYELKEFNRYKDLYWRAFSIINKVLVVNQGLEIAPYLDELHPIIEENDVINYLTEDEKARIEYINSDVGLIWG